MTMVVVMVNMLNCLLFLLEEAYDHFYDRLTLAGELPVPPPAEWLDGWSQERSKQRGEGGGVEGGGGGGGASGGG
eukprot:5786809-Pyramimonas_sp.AAC.1